jgi:hypothetical protein
MARRFMFVCIGILALALAYHLGSHDLPVRVIVCDGFVRRLAEDRASKVKARMLDPVPWSVTLYDTASGGFVLTRGPRQNHLVDQFTEQFEIESPTEFRSVHGNVFVRNPQVRLAEPLRFLRRAPYVSVVAATGAV